MADLADISDVTALLGGRELTEGEAARATAMLAQVSARFRREARQDFTPGASMVRLRVVGGAVVLQQWPAVEVLSVEDDAGQPVPFQHRGQEVQVSGDGVTLAENADGTPAAPVRYPIGFPAQRAPFVTVTYLHGSETVPADVVGAIAGAVQRALTLDGDASSGANQVTDTAGTFSRTRQFAAWAVGGQVTLSPDDLALARSYRVARPRSWVMGA